MSFEPSSWVQFEPSLGLTWGLCRPEFGIGLGLQTGTFVQLDLTREKGTGGVSLAEDLKQITPFFIY